MNILYLINYAGKGGTEKYIKLLSNYLKKKDNKIFFVYNKYGKLTEDMKKLGANIYKLKMNNPFDIIAIIKFAKLCKNNKIDIVHTQFLRENYIALLSKFLNKNIEVIHTVHLNINNNLFLKFTNKLITKKNKHIIAVCNSIKKILIKNNYEEKKIKVIFNGIKYEKNINNTKKYIRKEFNIDENTFVFITITRFSKEKGIFYLLKSIKKLSTITKEKFKVIFVGDGYLLKKAKYYAYKNKIDDYIIFTGYRDDIINFLDESNVFINSSKKEALSFAILEALSREKPVIITNVFGNKDIIHENLKGGFLVEYNNTKNMASTMKNILENKKLCETMGPYAKEIIKNKFNIDNTLLKTFNLYKNIKGDEYNKK